MSDGTTLWLIILGVLAAAAAIVLRRMSQLVARTRELERFQRDAATLDRQFAEATTPLVTALDDIRRHAGDPQALATVLPGASDALRTAAADARALRPPTVLRDRAAVLVRELGRAVRATELVEHGLDALLAARGNRELEAQVSLKRGALNLRHSREAFSLIVAEVASLDPAALTAIAANRSSAPLPTVPTYLVDGPDANGESAFDHRI